MKRAVVYARVSLDASGEGRSVERQEEACRALALARDWDVVAVQVDNSISAYTGKKRPGWDAVQRMIEADQVDVVIAWHLDRITRSMTELEKLIALVEQRGVGIATATGDIDLTTDVGRMVARILSAVARAEVERKAARQRLAHRQLAASGNPWTGGTRAFGYTMARDAVMPEEAEALHWAARHVIDGGTVAAVRREWLARGLLPSKPSKEGWTIGGIKKALLSSRNLGLREYHGEVTGPATWPAIFDQETHEALQAAFSTPRRKALGRRSGGGPKPSNLLSGICTCGRCRKGLTVSLRAGKRHYTCRRGCVRMLAELIEQHVIEQTVGLLASDTVLRVLVPSNDEKVQALRVEGDALRARMEVIGANYVAGNLDDESFGTMTAAVSSRLREVDAELQRSVGDNSLRGLDVGTEKVAAQWNALDLNRQREVIGALFELTAFPARGARNAPFVKWSADEHLTMTLRAPEGATS